MNQLLQQALGAILRHTLTGLAGYLVARGIWTQDAANEYVTAAAVALLSYGWMLWTKYRDRQKLVTALALNAGSTEAQVEAVIKEGVAAPVALGKHEAPYLSSRVRSFAMIAMLSAAMLVTSCGKSAPIATPSSPEGKAAYYGTLFMTAVRDAQTQMIAGARSGALPQSGVQQAVEGFVEIGRAGQKMADVLDVVDKADAVAKVKAAGEVDTQVRAITTLLNGLAARVTDDGTRAKLMDVLRVVNVAAKLLDVYKFIAPLLPRSSPPIAWSRLPAAMEVA